MKDSYLFRVFLVPSAVFLSVMFGAGYGSGRELVEFVTSNGPSGGIYSIASIALTYTIVLILCFEIARIFDQYEYEGFFKVLLGPGWFLYEIVILIGLVIALSITTTIGGTLLEDRFGISVWVGTMAVLGLIIILNYFGREIVERSMIMSVVALFLILGVLLMQVFSSHMEAVATSFATGTNSSAPWQKAMKYAIANVGYLPLILYCSIGLKTRREVIVAGVVASAICVLPALIFHYAYLAFYPEVVEQRLPTYWIFEQLNSPTLLNIYIVVMFVLIAQTGVGVLQGFNLRIDAWRQRNNKNTLGRTGHAMIAGGMVVVSMVLGTMGIVALVLRSYTLMSLAFVVVFVLPLLTYGIYLVSTKSKLGNKHGF